MPFAMTPQWRRIALGLCIVLLAVAAVKAGVDLWNVLRWEARGAMDSDVSDYFFVARGIRNGLLPYRDLYETKPPGIFFLTLLSLMVSGDQRFLSIVQLLVFIAIPLLFAAFAVHKSKERAATRWETVFFALLAFLLGSLLTLYLEERAGMLQTETWGCFFALLYALSLCWGKVPTTPRRIALSSVFLFATLFMREPFLLTTLAAAIVLCPTWRAFLRSFVLPLGIAGIAFLLIMTVLGYIGPYMTVHIPIMLWGRVAHDPLDPLWLRWLSIRWLFGNTTSYNVSSPLFGYVLILLFIVAPLWKRNPKGRWDLWMVIAGCGLVLVAAYYAYFLVVMINAKRLGVQLAPESVALLQHLLSIAITWGVLSLPFLFLLYKRGYLLASMLIFAGLFLSSEAVGISIYAVNHYTFAVPFYMALVLLLLQRQNAALWSEGIVVACSALAAVTVFTYQTDPRFMQTLEERTHYTYSANKDVIDRFDAMLDACHFDRYYTFGGLNKLQFAKHSPYGPAVILTYFNYLAPDHPLIQDTLKNIVFKTPVIAIFNKPDPLVSSDVDALIHERFTDQAPSCAKPYLPMDTAVMLFRK